MWKTSARLRPIANLPARFDVVLRGSVQKRCFSKVLGPVCLYNAKEAVLTESQADSEEIRTGYIRIKKVRVKSSRKRSV